MKTIKRPKTAIPKIEPVKVSAISSCEIEKESNDVIGLINEAIKNKNKTFSKMNKMEKRVALAKDVIAAIKSKVYDAEAGTYLTFKEDGITVDDDNFSVSKEELNNKNITCSVCAIGSLFVSKIRKTKIKNITEVDDGLMVKSLSGIFSELELRTLEYLFEGRDIDSNFKYNSMYNSKFHSDCTDFFISHPDDKSRLLSIMKNIVKNNGQFIYKDVKI